MRKEKIRIFFFIPSLGKGGAESHVLRLANHLDPEEYSITLILARCGGEYEPLLNDYIEVIYLNKTIKSSTASMILSILKLRQKVISLEPDILISFLSHSIIISYLSTRNLRKRPITIAGIQNNYSKERENRHSLISRFYDKYFIEAIKNSDTLISLSKGVLKDFLAYLDKSGLEEINYEVIYNSGISEINDSTLTTKKSETVKLLAVGRLENQKDYPTMLDAIAILKKRGLKVKLTVLGQGSREGLLRKKINDLGIEEIVSLEGFQRNTGDYFKEADIFLLSSKYEGFGNVIVEAMAYGLPVISTDCDYGPGEIIEDRVDGILVETGNSEMMAKEVEILIKNSELRKELGEKGRRKSQLFHPKNVAEDYSKLFKKLILETS